MNECVNELNQQSWGGAVWVGVDDGKEMLGWQSLNDAGTNQMLKESWVMQVLQSWRRTDVWRTSSLSDFVSISKRIVAVAAEKMQECLNGSLCEMVTLAVMLEGTENQTELKAAAAKIWSTPDEQVTLYFQQSAVVPHPFVWN
jgi:hypothetical protein